MILIYVKGCRRFQRLQFNALCHRAFDLSWQRCHIRHSPAIYNAYLGSAQPLRRADRIHRNISAADDCHLLAGQIQDLFLSNITQELNR